MGYNFTACSQIHRKIGNQHTHRSFKRLPYKITILFNCIKQNLGNTHVLKTSSGCLYSFYVSLALYAVRSSNPRTDDKSWWTLDLLLLSLVRDGASPKEILSSSGLASDFVSCEMNSCQFVWYIKPRAEQKIHMGPLYLPYMRKKYKYIFTIIQANADQTWTS